MLGSRVVRGEDWKVDDEEEDHNGGEGFVGTITNQKHFEDGSPLPDGTVLVHWDNGLQACYRAGQSDCYDLRILDSASAGIKFPGYSCCGCKESSIAGMRWHCAECPNCDLCTECYMKDVHDINHRFVRFDSPSDKCTGVHVGQRSTSSKMHAKGIFPGATVKTGKDWALEPLENGIVVKIASWEDISRSAVMVDWKDFCKMPQRVGHEGKVDLKLVQFALGPSYYEKHLPKVSLNNDELNIQMQHSLSTEKQVHQDAKMESQHAAPIHELPQIFQKSKASGNITNKVKMPPPRTLPKPSPRLNSNSNASKTKAGKSDARQEKPPTETAANVKDIIKMMSSLKRKDEDSCVGRTFVKPNAPSEATLLKTSKKSRPAPPPPRPHSAMYTDTGSDKTEAKDGDNIVAKKSHPAPSPPRPQSAIYDSSGAKKSVGISPSRGKVASLAANLGSVLNLDPTRMSRMQGKKPPIRELICTTCDEKASKVVFYPCGHIIDAACLRCAWKLKRCLKCNEPIDTKTTPDGLPLREPDNGEDEKNAKLRELERKLEETKRELECPICMDERCNILFGCGHKICKDCSELITQCPLCKQYITERKRMF